MDKQVKRPPWFKMWLWDKPLIDAFPDEVIGKALKAAMNYFETGELCELEPLAIGPFSMFKAHIDESFVEYQKSVENGRKRRRKNAAENVGAESPVREGERGLPSLTEEDLEVDVDADIDEDLEIDVEVREKDNHSEKYPHREVGGDREGVGGKEPKQPLDDFAICQNSRDTYDEYCRSIGVIL